jgi:hypothetical protein
MFWKVVQLDDIQDNECVLLTLCCVLGDDAGADHCTLYILGKRTGLWNREAGHRYMGSGMHHISKGDANLLHTQAL